MQCLISKKQIQPLIRHSVNVLSPIPLSSLLLVINCNSIPHVDRLKPVHNLMKNWVLNCVEVKLLFRLMIRYIFAQLQFIVL